MPRIKLYANTPDVVAGREIELDPTEPTLDIYLPDADKATGAGVLVLPGGGYQILTVPGEGPIPARFFLSHNVAAFVLRYRHGPRYHHPTTLFDAQRALRLIKAHAKDYRIDPAKVGVLGGSAGGHLAAMLATLYDNKLLPSAPYVPDDIDTQSARPAFALLLYPVIDLTDDAVTHRGSRTNLTQDNPALYAALSPQLHVTPDTPPVFLVHGTNDRLVPVKNSLLFYEASINAGVPAEMHILDNGPHGFGMGTNIDDETVREWPLQALRFMARHQMIPRSGEIAGLPAGEPDVLATLPGHIAVSERLHVSGQPSAEALAKLGSAGVHTVIDLRSDAETPDLDERAVVEKSGVAYRSLPVSGKQDLTRENVAKFDELLKQADSGKVLVHCSSGNRVGAMLALRARWVEGKSAAEALAVGKGAGLAGLEGEVKSLLDTDVVSGVVEMAPRVTY